MNPFARSSCFPLPHLLAVLLASASPGPASAQAVALTDVQAIGTRGAYGCALTGGGAVYCWGSNDRGQLGDGTRQDRYTPVGVVGLGSGVSAIAIGTVHGCALRTGTVWCWGDGSYGQLGDGASVGSALPLAVGGLPAGVTAIAAGLNHSCAITGSGALYCWGYNFRGQLGDGTNATRYTPVPVAGLVSGVLAVSAGGQHTCAITTGGAAWCWGYNDGGQLGDGSTEARLTPTAVSGLGSGAVRVSAGNSHTCAVTSTGAARCWGANAGGQLGDGSNIDRHAPVAVSGLGSGVAGISAGGLAPEQFSCAWLASGGARCWGGNAYGQLGDGSNGASNVPVSVTGLTGVTGLSAGIDHACAVASGNARCWGSNAGGMLGDGTSVGSSNSPVAVVVAPLTAPEPPQRVPLRGVQRVVSYGFGFHNCALTLAGGARCWGQNDRGQLGDGSLTSRHTAVDVTGLASGVTAIAAGSRHGCAVHHGGAVCWGGNDHGQLGNGSTVDSSVPVAVTGLGSGVVAVGTGHAHSCALTDLGALYCWGWNFSGQLGDGTTTDRSAPVPVSGMDAGVTRLSVGGSHTCALTGGGTAWCWGKNTYGQLGDGSTTSQTTARAVWGLDGVVAQISAGADVTCAITHQGAALCWGGNFQGAIGDGTTENRSVPVAVYGLGRGVSSIAAGQVNGHTCAVMVGGDAWCWGSNSRGQLGDGGFNTLSLYPLRVPGLDSRVGSITTGKEHTCVTVEGNVRCFGANTNGELGDDNVPNYATVPGRAVEAWPNPESGNAAATLHFLPPAANAGSIDHYRVTCNPNARTALGTQSPITVSGLLNGVLHFCTVAAHNAWGYSVESAVLGVMPGENILFSDSFE